MPGATGMPPGAPGWRPARRPSLIAGSVRCRRLRSVICVPSAVQPVIKLLVVQLQREVAVLCELLADLLVLQQVQKAQTVRVHEELGVLRLLPVLEVVEVADELAVQQIPLPGEPVDVQGVCETLNELELNQELLHARER